MDSTLLIDNHQAQQQFEMLNADDEQQHRQQRRADSDDMAAISRINDVAAANNNHHHFNQDEHHQPTPPGNNNGGYTMNDEMNSFPHPLKTSSDSMKAKQQQQQNMTSFQQKQHQNQNQNQQQPQQKKQQQPKQSPKHHDVSSEGSFNSKRTPQPHQQQQQQHVPMVNKNNPINNNNNNINAKFNTFNSTTNNKDLLMNKNSRNKNSNENGGFIGRKTNNEVVIPNNDFNKPKMLMNGRMNNRNTLNSKSQSEANFQQAFNSYNNNNNNYNNNNNNINNKMFYNDDMNVNSKRMQQQQQNGNGNKVYNNIYSSPTNNQNNGTGSSKSNTEPNVSTTTKLIARRKNLGPNEAYTISQKLKKDDHLIQKLDLNENNLGDEGVIYLAITLKSCNTLKSLSLGYNGITDYGLRILFENVNAKSLSYLDLSGNKVGLKGIELLSKFIQTAKLLQNLNLSSTGIEEEYSKSLGSVLNNSTGLKKLELSKNQLKFLHGTNLLARSILSCSSLEELYLSNNGVGIEGVEAICEFIKANKVIKLIDLSSNRLNYDCAVKLADSLKNNRTLRSLNVNNNNITTSGIYLVLNSINNETSKLEYLGLKGIPIMKQNVLLIEFIQQRRRFNCVYGPVVLYPDNSVPKISDDDSMVKLTKSLSEKRIRLIDMFRILDKNGTFSIEKNEFIRRLKIFDPKFLQKDLNNIADNFSNGTDYINYSSLNQQMSKPNGDQQYEINRRKLQIAEEEEKTFMRRPTFAGAGGGGGSDNGSIKSRQQLNGGSNVFNNRYQSENDLSMTNNNTKSITRLPKIKLAANNNNFSSPYDLDNGDLYKDDFNKPVPFKTNKLNRTIRGGAAQNQQQQQQPEFSTIFRKNNDKSLKIPNGLTKSNAFGSDSRLYGNGNGNGNGNGIGIPNGNGNKSLMKHPTRSTNYNNNNNHYDFLENFDYDDYLFNDDDFKGTYPTGYPYATNNSSYLNNVNHPAAAAAASMTFRSNNGGRPPLPPAASQNKLKPFPMDDDLLKSNVNKLKSKSRYNVNANNFKDNNGNSKSMAGTLNGKKQSPPQPLQPPPPPIISKNNGLMNARRKRMSKSLNDSEFDRLFDDDFLLDDDQFINKTTKKIPKRNGNNNRNSNLQPVAPLSIAADSRNINNKLASKSLNFSSGLNNGNSNGFDNRTNNSSFLDINKSYNRRKVNLNSNQLSLY